MRRRWVIVYCEIAGGDNVHHAPHRKIAQCSQVSMDRSPQRHDAGKQDSLRTEHTSTGRGGIVAPFKHVAWWTAEGDDNLETPVRDIRQITDIQFDVSFDAFRKTSLGPIFAI